MKGEMIALKIIEEEPNYDRISQLRYKITGKNDLDYAVIDAIDEYLNYHNDINELINDLEEILDM